MTLEGLDPSRILDSMFLDLGPFRLLKWMFQGTRRDPGVGCVYGLRCRTERSEEVSVANHGPRKGSSFHNITFRDHGQYNLTGTIVF